MIEVEIDKEVYLECFQHLIEENDIDIELIWGGRDSGKSKFLSQYLPELAMSLHYFRCALIKQTHESIKDSQWQMIKDTCEEWGVDHLFNFTVSPLSINCKTGNSFLARGMDKPGKIRSLANPSHAWGEEFNQVAEDGFVTLITGLRNDHGRVKLFLTFNPEAEESDYEDWWLYKTFFSKHYPKGELSFTDVIEIKAFVNGVEKVVKLKYRSTHVTYHDNPYVTPQRIAFHESLKITNPYWYRIFTEGLFGNKLNDSPYAFAFNRAKQVSNGTTIPHPVLNRAHPVLLSFDFNRNPMTSLVGQHYDQRFRFLEVIRIPHSGVDAMCEFILAKYPGCVFMVTGDYNGDNESSLFAEQVTHYLLIKKYLNLTDSQIRIRPNPKQAKNSTHINTVLSYYDIVIHGDNCKPLIFDLENVKRRADGTILKTDRDKPEQQADALDCVIGETLIITSTGEKRIDSIKLNEMVLTRQGYKRVIDKWHSMAETYEFEFTDGTKITCTKEHKFFNGDMDAWIPIIDLYEGKLEVCKIRHLPTPSDTFRHVKVKKVTYKGRQLVYDITVEDEHEFYANRILVHNCLRYDFNEFLANFSPTEKQIMNKAVEAGFNSSIQTINTNITSDGSTLKKEIINQCLGAIETGKLVKVLQKHYTEFVRDSILEQAGKWVDAGDGARAGIALHEIKRLDLLFQK
ncbi:MAG: phage terminase large subunit [Ginsengibacter sp.]